MGRGNAEKNWEWRQVSKAECEQVFFHRPIRVAPDEDNTVNSRTFGQITTAGPAREIQFALKFIW